MAFRVYPNAVDPATVSAGSGLDDKVKFFSTTTAPSSSGTEYLLRADAQGETAPQPAAFVIKLPTKFKSTLPTTGYEWSWDVTTNGADTTVVHVLAELLELYESQYGVGIGNGSQEDSPAFAGTGIYSKTGVSWAGANTRTEPEYFLIGYLRGTNASTMMGSSLIGINYNDADTWFGNTELSLPALGSAALSGSGTLTATGQKLPSRRFLFSNSGSAVSGTWVDVPNAYDAFTPNPANGLRNMGDTTFAYWTSSTRSAEAIIRVGFPALGAAPSGETFDAVYANMCVGGIIGTWTSTYGMQVRVNGVAVGSEITPTQLTGTSSANYIFPGTGDNTYTQVGVDISSLVTEADLLAGNISIDFRVKRANLTNQMTVEVHHGRLAVQYAFVSGGSGSGSGAFAFAGSAAGKRVPKGASSGNFAFTGAGTGVAPRKGAATGTFLMSGTASGVAPTGVKQGSSTTAFAFTGSASGAAPAGLSQGSAAGTTTFSGAASGQNLLMPTGLTATPVATDQIDLSWNASSGATGYDIERDSVVIVQNHGTTSYSDTGLNPATEYDYRVRARRG